MSTLVFRNVDASPRDPVSDWPVEAIHTALERGGLSDWRLLATEIRAWPWGAVARRVEDILSYSRPYGIAKAMERLISQARDEVEEKERGEVATEVGRLITMSGLSRAEFASQIGTSSSRLSTYATGKVTPSATLMLRMFRVSGETAKREMLDARARKPEGD
jgi:DNA-binding transcriptional regulator YiaG